LNLTITDYLDSCNFRCSEEEAQDLGLEQIRVPIVTLNDVLEDEICPEIIKIDAEGFDFQVLRGANKYFGQTEIFMVEAAVVCDEIQNTCAEMIKFMDSIGYRMFDITDLNRPFDSNVLWLMEIVFVKKGGVLDSRNHRDGRV